MAAGTLVLNSCNTVLAQISWQQAAGLVVAGKAEVVESDPERLVRSQHLSIPFPRIIRLIRWVYVKFTKKTDIDSPKVSKRAILQRDGFTCAYCGCGGASTVDHVLPESKGGAFSFQNLVAACGPCNCRKADRTPEQAGMRLLWHPWVPAMYANEQKRVWESLA